MLELDRANEFPMVGAMLHNKKLTSGQVQQRKFLYIEGLIRFLELYAQNEIGNVEVDIEKVALWVNSPAFENVDVYEIKSIHSVYKMLTKDLTERNVPLYRFLKLSSYQAGIFEKEHREMLLKDYAADCEKYPCLKCIWYFTEITSFGKISQCNFPKEKVTGKASAIRKGYHNISNHRKCKYITEVPDVDKFISEYVDNNAKCSDYCKRDISKSARHYAEKLTEKISNLDNSYIPLFIPDSVKLDLSEQEDMWKELGRAFNSKLPKSKMKQNYRFAIFLEAMIKFTEVYAQTEMGSDFVADISRIAKFADRKAHDKFMEFTSQKEIYDILESYMVEDEAFIKKFVRLKET